MKPRSSAEGVVVAAVRARTPAAAAGLVPGDRILAINGHALRDAIDFSFHGSDARLALSVERDRSQAALWAARRPRVSAEILPRLERLAKAGIRMHAQVVLCPGLNDGAHLERTVRELAPLYPHVATTAVVPVGLTRHRERLPALRTLTQREAQALVAPAAAWP